jgi:enoyl-CoA hydratase
LHPGGGCTYFLTSTLGASNALRVLLDGATIDAIGALRAGLVNEVVDDPESAALELAQRWALLEPELARDIKRTVGLAASGDFDATLDFELGAQARSAQGPRVSEAVARRSATNRR